MTVLWCASEGSLLVVWSGFRVSVCERRPGKTRCRRFMGFLVSHRFHTARSVRSCFPHAVSRVEVFLRSSFPCIRLAKGHPRPGCYRRAQGSLGRSLHSRPARCLHQSFSAPRQCTPRRGLPLLTWLLCVAIAAAAAMDMDVCCAYFCTGLSVFGVIALVRCHPPSSRAAPSRNARSPHAYRGVHVPPAGRLIPAAPLPVAALLVRRSHFRW